ncbi:MAG: phosphohistidine phosphatase SixA [Gammaproteobacteria bacterium]|nr:phosphohistidine phosphatase SixA [Gammaproteobacteria bacterium]
MRLFILRHGEAEPRASRDEERALTARGRAEVLNVAEQLKRRGERIGQIWASPYARAQETAALVCQTLGLPAAKTESGMTPDDPPWVFADKLRLEAGASLLIASHMPFVGRLLLELCPSLGSASFGTGCLAMVDLNEQGLASAAPQWLQPLADSGQKG